PLLGNERRIEFNAEGDQVVVLVLSYRYPALEGMEEVPPGRLRRNALRGLEFPDPFLRVDVVQLGIDYQPVGFGIPPGRGVDRHFDVVFADEILEEALILEKRHRFVRPVLLRRAAEVEISEPRDAAEFPGELCQARSASGARGRLQHGTGGVLVWQIEREPERGHREGRSDRGDQPLVTPYDPAD